MSTSDLVLTYKTHIRPVVEVNSVIIQPMISAELSESLERQQSLALSIIFGGGISAEKMRIKADVERLEDRRREACIKFVKKTLDSPRFGHWYTKRPDPAYVRRASLQYKRYHEHYARTDRRWNTPKYYFRRIANAENL